MALPPRRRRSVRGFVALALVVAVGLAASGCSGSGGGKRDVLGTTTLPTDTTSPPASTTTIVTEGTVPGTPRSATTIPAALGPGQARLFGTVTGPGGPIDGAVVRVERFVGQSRASVDVRTQGGSWVLDAVLGGAYRVQAFRPPDLAQGQAQSFFLGATEAKEVSLSLFRYGDNSLTATVAPNPPVVGASTLLTVTSADTDVDLNGQVVSVGRAGVRMQLVLSSGLGLETSATAITDGNGMATWRFVCLAPGAFSASLVIGGGGSTLTLPPCVSGPIG